ncbi:MAG: permease [Bacillota bacterium]|nr:permease [Bacillota bacterium]
MAELRKFLGLLVVFLAAYFVPFGHPRVSGAIMEAFHMLQEYARQHVLFCLVPALFIAGAIANFVSQASVIKYFSGQAKKWLSYSVASVSGAVLAVCSCTVLPLLAGIYQRGAGLGPAIAFLYSGPAINILAIILTARVLGWKLGLARALGAVVFSVVIGLLMAYIYRGEERERTEAVSQRVAEAMRQCEARSGVQNLVYFATMVGILVFAAWGKPAQPVGFWNAVFEVKWYLTGALLLVLAYTLVRWFRRAEFSSWVSATWGFAQQILPLLFGGVLVAGALMGRPGTDAGLIPSRWVEAAVGGNSLAANLLASVAGALMYFATLTEVPILQGLIGSGMGQGPALALLLAGPALSLPSMLVIRSVIGTKKTLTYLGLVVVMATVTGMVFGALAG